MTADWDELEPRREWTSADRWRLATWVLVFANVLALLLVAPLGDGLLAAAAEAAGGDGSTARLVFWISLLGCTLVGNGIGAAAAAMRKRWAIVPPLLATAGCWIGFFVAQTLV